MVEKRNSCHQKKTKNEKIMRVYLCLISVLFIHLTQAQTGIGTTTPDASAKLEVSATNKGFLPPRVTLTSGTDNTTIANPATGLLVYNTGNNVGLVAGYYYWNGASWATIATASGYAVGSSYLRGSRSAVQTTNLSVNSLVAFSQVDNISGQEIALNTSTGQITLAAGRTYRLQAQVPNMSGGTRPAFAWYNETTSSWVGSQSSIYSPGDAASYIAFGSVSDAIITANTTTVVSYRIYSGSSLGSLGGNADFGTVGSYPWFDVQVISGNAPVTGQSVDYAMASLSATQSISAVNNVIFNTIQGAGITLNNGGFNLTANKTYKLEGSVGGSSTGYIYYAWVDASNTIISGGSVGSVMKVGGSYSDGPQDKAVAFYTPATNTTVYLRVLSISGTSVAYPVAATPAYSSTWATIQQVGSSAIVNPWVLSGNNVYNTTGNVGIGTNAPMATLDVTGNVNVTGKINLTDPSGSVATKVSGFVNAGTFIQMENLKVTISTSTRSLVIAAVNSNFIANVSGWYGYTGGGGGGSSHDVPVTTTNTSAQYTWGFATEGDGAQYNILDKTSNKMYRVIMMIGLNFNNNFISIERLY
jgi:hypothetical protein